MVYIKTIGCMRKIAANDAVTLRVRSALVACDENGAGIAKRKAMNEAKSKWPEEQGWQAHFVVFSDEVSKGELLDKVWDTQHKENGA